jgi:hypothetical protein
MGKRGRRKGLSETVKGSSVTVDYTDPDGSVLTLRESISGASSLKLRHTRGGGAASTVDDQWRRRTELLFERFVVSWEIAGLPLTGQRELLGRYRMADQATQRWVRTTIDDHVRAHQPELAE